MQSAKIKGETDSKIRQYLLNCKKRNHSNTVTPVINTSRNHNIEKRDGFTNSFHTVSMVLSNISKHKLVLPRVTMSPLRKYNSIYAPRSDICKSRIIECDDPMNISFSKKAPHFTIVEKIYIKNLSQFHKIRDMVCT